MPHSTTLLFRATLQCGNNIQPTPLCAVLLSITRSFYGMSVTDKICSLNLNTYSCTSGFRMSKKNATNNETESLSSQQSGTKEVTERLKEVTLSPPALLDRNQRRLMEHLRKKFNIAEEVARERAASYHRKKRQSTSDDAAPAKKHKPAPQLTKRAQIPTDCEGTGAANGKNAPAVRRGKAKKAETAPPAPPRTQQHTHKKVGPAKAASANAAPPSAVGRPERETSKAAFVHKVSPKRVAADCAKNPKGKHSGKRPTITMADALKCRRLAIVGKAAFTDDERNRIKDAICKVVLSDQADIPPEFHGVMCREGYLVATVADQESALWLLTNQDAIAKESRLELEIMSEDKVPVRRLYRALFSHSKDRPTAEIFLTLERFSRDSGFTTLNWDLVRRVEDDRATVLFVYVDEESHQHIRSCRNQALPYRLGHANFYRAWNEGAAEGGEAMECTTAPVQEAPPAALSREILESTPGGSGSTTAPLKVTAKVQRTISEQFRRSARAKGPAQSGSNGQP